MHKLKTRLRYGVLQSAASYLPERVLNFLHVRVPIGETHDGWTFWCDASYARACRTRTLPPGWELWEWESSPVTEADHG